MRKVIYLSIIALAILCVGGNTFAQKKYVNKASAWAEKGERLDTALKLIQLAEQDEKTKEMAKTYYVKGLIYDQIAKSTNPEFKGICDYPLVKAFDNYKKAYNMGDGKMLQGSIDAKLLMLTNSFVNSAVTAYQDENFKDAFIYFEKTLEVKEMPVFQGEIDTAVIFNTAVTAQRIADYDNAIKYYEKSIALEYGEGDTYSLLADAYKAKGDTLNYIGKLKEGFEKYPSNQALLSGIINYYLLESENPEEAFKYLEVAREKDPSNPQFYSAEGHLYDKTGNKDKAKEKYKKAIELNPNFFEAYYNLGVLFFNEGVELTDKANAITDNKKYEAAKKIADDKFLESLPYIEKAHELQPTDKGIMTTLKNLYYRFKMTDKYEEISKKLEE